MTDTPTPAPADPLAEGRRPQAKLTRLPEPGAAARTGTASQPVSVVSWVDRDELRANAYNPNHVAPPELRLLALSILEDGWTQPIVARRADGEIVDGYHRWLVSAHPDVAKLTDGYVPVVYLRDDVDPAHQRMSTVRHNRARGTHHVLRMADLVCELADQGLDAETIGRRLQMDAEEVRRLLERGNKLERGANPDGLGQAWTPDVAGETDTRFYEQETTP